MFESLQAIPADPILALMLGYRNDERADKIDLGVGIYKDANGQTPVMQAIKLAEKKLHEEQHSKAPIRARLSRYPGLPTLRC